MIDFMFRCSYIVAYRLARVVWKFYKPHINGVFLMLICNGQLLILKNSYKQLYSVPGGLVDRNESWEEAVIREAGEEVGITISLDQLVFIADVTGSNNNKNDKAKIYEVHLEAIPEITIDNREVVWAEFVAWEQLSKYRFVDSIETYIAQQQS